MKKEALLLVGSIPPEGGDNAIEDHLDALGYQVTVREGASAEDYHVNGKDLVIISSTAASDKTEESHHSVSQKLRSVKAPIIVLGGDLFDDMGMTESNGDLAETGNRTEVRIVHPGHPMAAGLSGEVIISEQKATRVTGKPNKKAIKIAVLTSRPSRVAIFAYKSGASMPGLIAPARRVGFLFSHEIAATATAQGWALFNAAVKWAVCAKEFDEIFRDEWEEIKDRRKEHYRRDQGIGENRPPNNLVGLALSGGGIRSATFCLGLLQGMHKLKLVRIFDYLSTVSGGGYLGGWWSAWLARDGLNAQNKGIAPHLTVDDLKNPTSLMQKLKAPAPGDRLSRYFREKLLDLGKGLSDETRKLLTAEVPPRGNFAEFLVKDLNKLINGSTLYDEKGFEIVALTDETRELLEQELQGGNLVRLNRLLLEEAYPDEIYRGLFPAREGIEPERMGKYITRQDTQKVAEGSLSAGNDPVHHLRLFAHYLMPRKGWLSGDRWRAVASLSRNFLLTWLILLPILLEVVLLGQLYFILQNGSPENFFHSCWSRIEQKEKDEKKAALALADFRATRCADCEPEPPIQQTQREAGSGASGSEKPPKEVELEQAHKRSVSELNTERADLTGKLQERAIQVLWVLLPIVGWIVLMIVGWLRSNITKHPFIDWVAHTLGGIGALVVIACVLTLYDVGVWTRLWALLRQWQEHVGLTVAVLVWLAIAAGLWLYTWPWGVKEWEWRKEVRKNKNIRVNAVLLVGFVIVASLLVLSGFGHEAANYLWKDPRPQKAAVDYVAKAGGWAAIAMAVFGSIFTMFKTAPSGGEDKNKAAGTRAMTLAILQITPPLVMVVLMVVLAWVAHGILDHVKRLQEENWGSCAWTLFVAAFAGLALCFFFAIFEMRKWRRSHRVLGWFSVFMLGSAALGTGAYFWMLATSKRDARYFFLSPVFWSLAVAIATGLIVLLRFTLLKGKTAVDGPTASAREPAREEVRASRRSMIENLREAHPFWIVIGASVLAIPVAVLAHELLPDVNKGFAMKLTSAALAGIFFCLAIAILEMLVGEDDSLRSKLLVLSAYLLLVGFLLVSFYFNPAEPNRNMMLGFVALGVLALVLTWIVAFGWMADPNALSMHLFYKSRLVRAYLGASNLNRSYQEITEAVPGDDMLLSTLKNCERGGPYHLINTTLNLVGGRDLSTSQRSSAYFVLSKRYCGSSRTGYRPTDQYMDGRFTLGTAVAVSGAAISPNMGAKNMTAALAMLMTLLNVRLGYWAPTPNQGSWPSPQARLWPFYMLREFLSQTTDLSSYCYLTDGGHFDNTGLYSLVERGCRYIVLVDAGADPNTCFEDLGDAIRRCRIDFGAEIKLDFGPLFKKLDDDSHDFLSAKHFVVGAIKYSPVHLERLNWTEQEIELDREGVIILIKPSLVANDLSDVRQYHRQNPVFPQQSTLDQWFDEAQFESYRRLGEDCAKVAFGGVDSGEKGNFDNLKNTDELAPTTVKHAFEKAKHAFDKEKQAFDKEKHSGKTKKRRGNGPPPSQEPGEEPAPEKH